VDNITLAASNQSIRYSSSAGPGDSTGSGDFRRQIYDAANNLVSEAFPALTVVNGEPRTRFIDLMELNVIDPTRLVIDGPLSIYESLDQGDTITQINIPEAFTTAMAYGGRSGGVDNPDVLYVGIGFAALGPPRAAWVLLRTTAGAPLLATAKLPDNDNPVGADRVNDIVMDPDDWRSAYVISSNNVFQTTNAGGAWTELTGNLSVFGAGRFNTIAFVTGGANNNKLLLVGTNRGVYVSFSSSGFTRWSKLGIGLPNAQVLDLDYDVVDDVLLAGTLGRGAWTITNLRNVTPPSAQP
jgi:hypothetical protein